MSKCFSRVGVWCSRFMAQGGFRLPFRFVSLAFFVVRLCVCVYIYIYIYIFFVYLFTHIYLSIYLSIYKEISSLSLSLSVLVCACGVFWGFATSGSGFHCSPGFCLSVVQQKTGLFSIFKGAQ